MSTCNDWRLPYRSMDAAGSEESAMAVGWAWIRELHDAIAFEDGDERLPGIEEAGSIDGSKSIALYHGTELRAVATIFRDPMNFAVLVRWKALSWQHEMLLKFADRLERREQMTGYALDAAKPSLCPPIGISPTIVGIDLAADRDIGADMHLYSRSGKVILIDNLQMMPAPEPGPLREILATIPAGPSKKPKAMPPRSFRETRRRLRRQRARSKKGGKRA